MKKKEFAVGEVFQFGLKKLKVLEVKVTTPSLKCIYCYFTEACKDTDPTDVVGECEANKRSDRMEVIFAEVEDEE